jgi:hypothetical protein
VGWVADAASLRLSNAGVATTVKGYVQVDAHLQTTVPHIFAAGDITGRLMLVPQALQDGFVAASNALESRPIMLGDQASPIGGFTDPEYAQVGLTEAKAREAHDVIVAMIHFGATVRTIIDGRTTGFCKLIVDRTSRKILGCHVVGERAVEIVQIVAIVMAAGMPVDTLADVPLSFPTYAGILGRAAAIAARELRHPLDCAIQSRRLDGEPNDHARVFRARLGDAHRSRRRAIDLSVRRPADRGSYLRNSRRFEGCQARPNTLPMVDIRKPR